MFDGILFDLDGTLWNAVPQLAKSWTFGLQELGVRQEPVTEQELYPCMGLLLEDIVERLSPGLEGETAGSGSLLQNGERVPLPARRAPLSRRGGRADRFEPEVPPFCGKQL